MRRRSAIKLPAMIIMVVVMLLVIMLVKGILGLGERGPKEVVESFYKYEQEGDFGSAWELFHPVMKERFSKNAYVTERSHIYMSHYGVETFTFVLGKEEDVQNWKMAEDMEKFEHVSRIEVTQLFKSKFGTFTVVQDVYAVEEEDEWKIVWEFQ